MNAKIAAPDAPTLSLDTANLVMEMHDAVAALLAEGFDVYRYMDRDRDMIPGKWVIIERGGNVGTVQYDPITGYSVDFAIKPSREVGSGLSVLRDDEPEADAATVQSVVLAAGLATQDSYCNFATNGRALPNHGWAHFAWARERLTRITEHDENLACKHCGKPGGHGPGDN